MMCHLRGKRPDRDEAIGKVGGDLALESLAAL